MQGASHLLFFKPGRLGGIMIHELKVPVFIYGQVKLMTAHAIVAVTVQETSSL